MFGFSIITQEIVRTNNMNNHELFSVMKDLNVLQQIATLIRLIPSRNQRPHDVTGTDERTPYITNETDVLIMRDYLDCKRLKILTRNDLNIVKEICWMISNIAAGTQDQVMKITNLDIIPLLQPMFVEMLQVISTYGYVENSQAYTCDKSGCRITLFLFYDYFVFVLFCFFFLCYFILFLMRSRFVFSKNF